MCDGDIADGDAAAVVVDAPAVLLDAIDALGVADIVVDIHDEHGVVGVDVNLIGVVCGTVEAVAVDAARGLCCAPWRCRTCPSCWRS